jgi:hypothetical protein
VNGKTSQSILVGLNDSILVASGGKCRCLGQTFCVRGVGIIDEIVFARRVNEKNWSIFRRHCCGWSSGVCVKDGDEMRLEDAAKDRHKSCSSSRPWFGDVVVKRRKTSAKLLAKPARACRHEQTELH